MKKTIQTLALFGGLCAFGLTSCDKIKDDLFPAFEAQIGEVAVTIPITVMGAESTASGTVPFNLDSTIKAYTENAFSISHLNSVKIKDLNVAIINGDNLNDVSNFETVTLKLASNTNTTPAVIVSAPIPNTPATDINIDAANSPDLKEYLVGDRLTYTLTGKARKATTKPLQARLSVTLTVK
jgi:hypothetical protein